MNAILGLCNAVMFFLGGWGQQTPPPSNNAPITTPKPAVRPIRITIRHADPWFVVRMLEGVQVQFPELSTLQIPGLLAPPGGTGLALFKGKFVVNPTDNSIWFYPEN